MPSPTRVPPRAAATALALAAAAIAAAPPPARAAEGLERVSVGPGGRQADGSNVRPELSADGRFVAFTSSSTNLVPGDTNGVTDIFVRDLRARTTTRASVGPGGVQADEQSYGAVALSADGRLVAFQSEATNLVPGDTNGGFDVFVRDRTTGKTARVSVGPGGRQGDGLSMSPTLSADGRYVAFSSGASNLVPRDTNDEGDVFVHDRRIGRTARVSVGPGGVEADGRSAFPAISADGRHVAFWSVAANLVAGDTNRVDDVFVRDLAAGRTERVSVGPGGTQADGFSFEPAISADGRVVVFISDATNLVPGDTNGVTDVFVHDRGTGETRRVNVGPGGVQDNRGPVFRYVVALSGNGQHVAFMSLGTNLVPGDTNGQEDVFVHNRRTGVTRRASVGPGGVQAEGGSYDASISADGRLVAFESDASNLVPGDTNNEPDVFVRTRR